MSRIKINQLQDINVILIFLLEHPDLEYIERLFSIVNILKLPFIPSKSNEERTAGEIIKQTFEILGELSHFTDQEISYCSIEVLVSKIDFNEKHYIYYMDLIEESTVIQNITKTMDLYIQENGENKAETFNTSVLN